MAVSETVRESMFLFSASSVVFGWDSGQFEAILCICVPRPNLHDTGFWSLWRNYVVGWAYWNEVSSVLRSFVGCSRWGKKVVAFGPEQAEILRHMLGSSHVVFEASSAESPWGRLDCEDGGLEYNLRKLPLQFWENLRLHGR